MLDPPQLKEDEGGQPRRPPDQYSNGWWRRIKIAADKKKSKEDDCEGEEAEKRLIFTAFTERARSEEKLLPTQRKLIESFINKAIDEPVFTNQLGSALFELLVPNAFKDQVGSQGDLLIIVDDESAQYPWELMAERRRDEVVALVRDRGMIRQLVTGEFRLAGHGFYNPKCPTQSGMVLGDGLWLTAAEFGQMRIIPDLVFLNCCSLSKIDQPDEETRKTLQANRLAASVSMELIRIGVKAVVAAGWEVDDAAAKTFAEVFYELMLDDRTFGFAIKEARAAIFRDYPGSNTWGAYQCYGNPEFRLRYQSDSETVRRKNPPILTRGECLNELKRSSEKAKGGDAQESKRVQARLEKIYADSPPKWLDAGTLAVLGDAWGELGKFDESRSYYQRSLEHEESNLTLRQLQRHANLIGRSAIKIYDAIVGQMKFLIKMLGAIKPLPQKIEEQIAAIQAIHDELVK